MQSTGRQHKETEGPERFAGAGAIEGHGADGDSPDASKLNVLLLYEDLETGLRGRRLFASLTGQTSLPSGARLRLWRCDLLETALLREQAALEAAVADVVILSLHGDAELSDAVRAWLSRWSGHKADRPCALGVLLDAAWAAQSQAHPLVAHLQSVALSAGADLFCGYCETYRIGCEAGRRPRPADRQRNAASARVGDIDPTRRYSRWGLNE